MLANYASLRLATRPWFCKSLCLTDNVPVELSSWCGPLGRQRPEMMDH